MPLRLIADAPAQTSIALALGSGATSFVGGSTASFSVPQNVAGGQGSLTIFDQGNPAWNPASPFATPFEYATFSNNNTGTNTISGLTRGVAGTTAHSFFANALVAQGLLAEDLVASVPWKCAEVVVSGTPSSILIPASGSIPASILGVTFRHLELSWNLVASSASIQQLQLQFNGDSTSGHYTAVNVISSGTVSGAATTSTTAIGIGQIGNISGFGSAKVLDYADTARRRGAVGSSCAVISGVVQSFAGTGDWTDQTTAITSCTLTLVGGGTFAAGVVTLYLIP